MNQSIASKAASLSMSMNKSQIEEKTDGTTSKYFPKPSMQQLRMSTMSKSNARNTELRKDYVNRIISSENVSRKKTFYSKTVTEFAANISQDNNENYENFFENLQKNMDKNALKQLVRNKPYKKTPVPKKKPLFSEDTLKLMTQFKESVKERDELQAAMNSEQFELAQFPLTQVSPEHNGQAHSSPPSPEIIRGRSNEREGIPILNDFFSPVVRPQSPHHSSQLQVKESILDRDYMLRRSSSMNPYNFLEAVMPTEHHDV